MEKLEQCKSRLATLTGEESGSLAACRSLQDRLRKLKREVLAELLTVRARIRKEARESLRSEPSLRKLWKHRSEIVKDLLSDAKDQATGKETDEHAAALAAWAEINQEIDTRLDNLRKLEQELARTAGEDVADRSALANRPRIGSRDAGDLYAAAGAAALERKRRDR